MLGDILETANSCLDYLVCELVRLGNKEPTSSHQFPLVSNREAFDKELGRGRLANVPFAAVAMIEGLQPYDTRTDPVHRHLKTLRTLTNRHKHRNLLLTHLLTASAPQNISTVEHEGELYVAASEIPHMVDLQTKFGPYRIADGKVEVNPPVMFVIGLKDPDFAGYVVPKFIGDICTCLRDEVLPQFAGYF